MPHLPSAGQITVLEVQLYSEVVRLPHQLKLPSNDGPYEDYDSSFSTDSLRFAGVPPHGWGHSAYQPYPFYVLVFYSEVVWSP